VIDKLLFQQKIVFKTIMINFCTGLVPGSGVYMPENSVFTPDLHSNYLTLRHSGSCLLNESSLMWGTLL